MDMGRLTANQPTWRWQLMAIMTAVAGLMASAGRSDWRLSALAGVGVLLGATLYHAEFGFASGYRRLIAHRDGSGMRAQITLLVMLTLLFTPLLLSGSARGAVAPVALRSAIGAMMFGIGMQLGSGCACGTLYAIGGGSTLMLFTLVSFSAGSFLATITTAAWQGLPSLEPWSFVQRWGVHGVVVQLLLLGLLNMAVWCWQHPTPARNAESDQRVTWRTLLMGPWSPTAGAISLALLGGLTLWIAGRPWGVTWGFTLWAAKLAHALGWEPAAGSLWQQARFDQALKAGVLQDITSVMNIGIVLGAAGAAAAARRLQFRRPSSIATVGGSLLGGLLMGYGSWLAFGCNVGAYLAGIASTSLHGWLWISCVLIGTVIGVRLRPHFGLRN